MRIAMLTNNYKPFVGGVPISIERLSESLRALGHEVYIFAPSYDKQVEEEGVIRYRSYKRTLANGTVIPYVLDSTIEKQFKELDIDLIHVHHPNFVGWMATYLGKKYDVPVVYTYHTRYEQYLHHVKGLDKLDEVSKREDRTLVKHIATGILKIMQEKMIPRAVKQYANRCEVIFAPTALMQELLEQDGVTSKIQILPTGLNEQFFKEDLLKANQIRGKHIGDKRYLFCTVSRLNKEKNIEFLIQGLGRLKQRIGDTFTTLIIGEGPLKEQLQSMVRELELEKNVVFLGNVPNQEIKDYYRACDMFLFASKSETQGIVLLEAMAAKNPVVAIKASGVVEVVKDGINGYMTEDNIEEWASKISYILSNPRKLEEMKQGAYKTAQSYSAESVAEIAEAYYKQAILAYHAKETLYYDEVGCHYEELYIR